jgi:membrane-associated phospholipid phosphatase
MKCKIFSLLVIWLFTFVAGHAQNLDIRLLRDINLHRNRSLDGTFKGITNSVGPSYAVPVVILGIGLIGGDSLTRQKGLFIGASMLVSTAITTVLKYGINRPRPYVTYPEIEKLTSGGSPSFPSGHTSDAFALATSLSIVYPKWYVIAPSFVWAGAVAYSRMDLGVHYPSDVLGGMIVGSGSAFLCHKANQWLIKKKQHNPLQP